MNWGQSGFSSAIAKRKPKRSKSTLTPIPRLRVPDLCLKVGAAAPTAMVLFGPAGKPATWSQDKSAGGFLPPFGAKIRKNNYVAEARGFLLGRGSQKSAAFLTA
jgi:hypothetical protein